jgi:uncharacterized membrane protein YqaE (UPF0057 family)
MTFSHEKHTIIILISIFVFIVWYMTRDYYNMEQFASKDDKENRIDDDEWTFFDKIMYGGIGYGNICLPTHLFRVIITILFPPLGIVIKYIKITDDFPWFSLGDLIMNIGELIKSLMLTAFFYIPGLIYSLNQLKCSDSVNCGK